VYIHESQFKAWESPGRELTKISKKKTWKGLILKDEIGDSSSSHHTRLVSFWSDYSRADVSLFVVSWEAGRAQVFWRVILHGEAWSRVYFYLREAGFTRLWWIQRTISIP
jgi:hypothetical protein